MAKIRQQLSSKPARRRKQRMAAANRRGVSNGARASAAASAFSMAALARYQHRAGAYGRRHGKNGSVIA